jgi:hypothetical protein
MVKEESMMIVLSVICIIIIVATIVTLLGVAVVAGCSAVHYTWKGVHDKLDRVIGDDQVGKK